MTKLTNSSINNEQNTDHTAYLEHRREPRYLCVGIPLLYSALKGQDVNDLGEKLYNASVIDMSLSGLAFDVDEPLQRGDRILVLIDKSDIDADDELMTEVRWCKALPSGLYRIGVIVDNSLSWSEKLGGRIKFSGVHKAPAEVETRCPACNNKSTFEFSGYQPILDYKAQILLYDCSVCGTTRSLTGIISSNSK